MRPFVINGDVWRPVMVDPSDRRLVDRTGRHRIATTDPSTRCVYLSRELRGPFLLRVMTHEVGHCAMVSYGVLERLHDIVPEGSWVDVEEWACNLLADYGAEILDAARVAIGPAAVREVA